VSVYRSGKPYVDLIDRPAKGDSLTQEVAVFSLPLILTGPHDGCCPAAGRSSGKRLRTSIAAGLANA
jgi:hypothetical protein